MEHGGCTSAPTDGHATTRDPGTRLRRGRRLIAALGALTALTALPTSTAAADPVVVNVPGSIDATGATDVTGALLAFFDTVADGSTVEFPAGARYRVDGTLHLVDRHDLTIDGNGAKFKATTKGDRGRRQFHFRGGSNITVREVVVVGAHPEPGKHGKYYKNLEAQHGFDFWGVDGVLVEDVVVRNVYGDFLYLGMDNRDHAAIWSKNVVVRDSTFRGSGRQGITINAAENVLIANNSISEVRRSTFDIEPNGGTWGVRHVRIVANQIGAGRLNFVANHGSRKAVFDDVQIVDNVLTGKAMKMYFRGGTGAGRRANLLIEGNVSNHRFGSGRGVIEVENFDGVTIRDNTQPFKTRRHGNKRMTAVKVKGSCDVDVSGNHFTGLVTEKKITNNHPCS